MDRYSMLPSRDNPNFAEHYKALDWVILGFLYTTFAAFVVSLFAYPLGHMVSHDFSAQAWENVKQYYAYMKSHPFYYFKSYFRWFATFFSVIRQPSISTKKGAAGIQTEKL